MRQLTKMKKREMTIRGNFLQRYSFTMLFGQTGIGKTFVSLESAVDHAINHNSRVYYFNPEIEKNEVRERVYQILGDRQEDKIFNLKICTEQFELNDIHYGKDFIKNFIDKDLEDYPQDGDKEDIVIIIDSITSLMAGGLNDSTNLNDSYQSLRKTKNYFDATVLVLDLSGTKDKTSRPRGISIYNNYCNNIFALDKRRIDSKFLTLKCRKSNYHSEKYFDSITKKYYIEKENKEFFKVEFEERIGNFQIQDMHELFNSLDNLLKGKGSRSIISFFNNAGIKKKYEYIELKYLEDKKYKSLLRVFRLKQGFFKTLKDYQDTNPKLDIPYKITYDGEKVISFEIKTIDFLNNLLKIAKKESLSQEQYNAL